MDKQKEKQFIQAYNDYAHLIVRHIYFRVSNREVAQDILQETFLKSWQNAVKQDKEIDDMKKYLYTVANHLIIDHYRQKDKTPLYLEEVNKDTAFYRPDLDIKIDRRVKFDLANRYISNLEAHYRKILTFHYIESMSISEISKLTGQSPNHVSVIKYRGLKMLKRIIKQSAAI